jgi:4'-phosphopantetheinyl transferase
MKKGENRSCFSLAQAAMFSKHFEKLQWSRAPKAPVMNHGEVHLWKLTLDLPCIGHLRAALSLTETLNAERLLQKEERRRFISGCGQLREVLSRYLGIEPGKISLGYALSGEPLTLRSSHALYFDWARAEGLALVAVSSVQNVTVELERVCHFLPTQTLVDHFFQPEEIWDFRTCPAKERQQRFYRTWTGREAYRRCRGENLHVREFVPADGFAAAIAAEGEDWQLRSWER